MLLYKTFLWTHSYLRWLIVIATAILIVATARGWRRGSKFSTPHERLQRAVLGLVDTQFLLGLALFLWLSPISKGFFTAPAIGMKDSALRFFGMEHPLGMLLAIGVLHGMHRRSRLAPSDAVRHRRACLGAVSFLVLAVASIPWPGTAHGRPLFRRPEAASGAAPSAVEPSCPSTYGARCAACHGDRGRGDGMVGRYLKPPARNFAEPGFLQARSRAGIRAVIRDGGAAHGLSAAMPAHVDLSEQEVDALVACVQSLGQR
ncbi:MAG TPA: cytochrome c [Polyangiaceae bacterium]|nr:cytochrome c [Polyangiaceae bacterium]